MAIKGEGKGGDAPIVVQGGDPALGVKIPQIQGAVAAPRGEPLAIGANGDRRTYEPL